MFFETIKVLDGRIANLELHMARLTKTMRHFFPHSALPDISLNVPAERQKGLYRCRITYAQEIERIEFIPYTRRKIATIALVDAPTLRYSWKFCNRNELDDLKKASGHDEVIIVKDGAVTDTTFSNLVFENSKGLFTPRSFLLPGVRRTALLCGGIVRETQITVNDLYGYQRVFLINAMLGLEDRMSFSIAPSNEPGQFTFIAEK